MKIKFSSDGIFSGSHSHLSRMTDDAEGGSCYKEESKLVRKLRVI